MYMSVCGCVQTGAYLCGCGCVPYVCLNTYVRECACIRMCVRTYGRRQRPLCCGFHAGGSLMLIAWDFHRQGCASGRAWSWQLPVGCCLCGRARRALSAAHCKPICPCRCTHPSLARAGQLFKRCSHPHAHVQHALSNIHRNVRNHTRSRL